MQHPHESIRWSTALLHIAIALFVIASVHGADAQQRDVEVAQSEEALSPAELLLNELADSAGEEPWYWQSGQVQVPATGGWQAALDQAQTLRSSNDQSPHHIALLAYYQDVLDKQPPPEVDSRIRFEMGAMARSYGPEGHEQRTIAYLAQIVRDHRTRGQYRSVIAARNHLVECLTQTQDPGQYAELIDSLMYEILTVPEDEIVFGHPENEQRNMQYIRSAIPPSMANANLDFLESKAAQQFIEQHRDRLLAQRQRTVNNLRQSTRDCWIRARVAIEPDRPRNKIVREIHAIYDRSQADPARQ